MFVYFFSTATHHILTADSSVLNAAALSIAGLRRSAHITNTLASFHWLRAPSESSSNWRHRLPSSSQDCATVTVWRHGLIGWAVADTPSPWDDVGRQLPTNLLPVSPVLSQLVNDHLLLLAQSCGTVFQVTLLHLLHHWQCFDENWKHIYFGSDRTLLCSLFVVVLAMVALAVIYFGHLKHCSVM